MKSIPAYRQVYKKLKEGLQNNLYPVGSMLPIESEIEKQFGVSRTTVRKAISMLINEGFLRTNQGKGTEVLDPVVSQKLNSISSVTESLIAKGFTITCQGMRITKEPASEKIAEALEIKTGQEVYKLERLQNANGIPFAIMTNYLRPSVVPNFETHENKFSGLYKFLEQEYGIVLKSAVERISAVSSNFMESQLLHIPTGSPLLLSKRVTSTESGPFEYSIIKLIPDKYEFIVYMTGR